MIHLTGPDRPQSRCWVMNWNQTQLYAQRKGSFSPASGFALFVASTSDEVTLELKSRISLCCPCQSRIPTLQKHKIPLPLATEIPASHPFFQLKSRISLQKKGQIPRPAKPIGDPRGGASWSLAETDRIAYANETNIVNKDSHIDSLTLINQRQQLHPQIVIIKY